MPRPRPKSDSHRKPGSRPAVPTRTESPAPSPSRADDEFDLVAVTAFGLEAVVARELRELGYEPVETTDGQVVFRGGAAAVCRANLHLRCADRVQIRLGEFEARDFDQLFDRTRDLPWDEWLPVDARFPVNGRSVRSTLHSVPDCQAMVKKAIVEKLKTRHRRTWFDETGPLVPIDVVLRKDRAQLLLDTSGAGLHKRGWRTLTGEAPLRETLAAALVQLSYWNRERPFLDPCCGTGTIPVEAALLGRRIAPGLRREFVSEAWPRLGPRAWRAARTEAEDLVLPPLESPLVGTDIDEQALSMARHHARQAGVADDVHFQQKPLAELTTSRRYGCLVANPPYGERMGDAHGAEELYRTLGRFCAALDTWSIYVLTAHPGFERCFGRQADRRRKLYNGRIACTYHTFFGPPPPQSDRAPGNAESAAKTEAGG